jgi:hypothetical protein
MRRSSLILTLVAGCASSAPPAPNAPRPPPAVVTGAARLTCNIDTAKNGIQKLELVRGAGIEFDAVVLPIVGGTVRVKGPDKGGSYGFTSQLAEPAKGKLTGIGEVTIQEMETKVTVELEKYVQPDGPGTPLRFSTQDLAKRGIYVEFSGWALGRDGKKHAFRVNLGPPEEGSGEVQPRDSSFDTNIVAKTVIMEAPTMTVVDSIPVTTTIESE